MMKRKITVIVSVLAILLLTVPFFACDDDKGKTYKESGHILELEPMKDQFKDYFMIGNIYSNGYDWKMLDHHYNVITAENMMKPSYMLRSISGSTVTLNTQGIDAAKVFVDTAIAAGHKVVGHTLLWHSQNPAAVQEGWPPTNKLPISKETTLAIMKDYITKVVGHEAFKNKIYSWDVLNEVFNDNRGSNDDWKASGVMRNNNPWLQRIGPEFIFEGFLAARFADPNTILYYNDFNTDNANKARVIAEMVKEINNQYLALPADQKPAGEPADRLLIEGIGMQEHHNTNVQPSAVKATIDLFRAIEFTGSSRKILLSVSELDVLAQGYSSDVDKQGPPAPNNDLNKQAELYGEYFKIYLDNADIIERVSFWGITDNQSWRSAGQPLIFDNDGNSKAAYTAIINALKAHKAK